MSVENELVKVCPFWEEPCPKVCPACPLYIEIMQTQMVLGIQKVVEQKMCYFPASAMIMSSRPSPGQQPFPFIRGN